MMNRKFKWTEFIYFLNSASLQNKMIKRLNVACSFKKKGLILFKSFVLQNVFLSFYFAMHYQDENDYGVWKWMFKYNTQFFLLLFFCIAQGIRLKNMMC